MFSQTDFGQRLKEFRKRMNLTQKEASMKIGVSEQALSKWENGVCLPDLYNLKLLARILRVSIDCLLDTEGETPEKVVETIKVGSAIFEVVEKPATILAGKILYANAFSRYADFDAAIEAFMTGGEQSAYASLTAPVLPISDIHLSVNFWRSEDARAYGFVREVSTDQQPEGVDVYKLPASLYIRAYTDPSAARLMAKSQCEVWELFAYIRNYIMPEHGFQMAENGAQELEVFDTSEHKTGFAYLPVRRA